MRWWVRPLMAGAIVALLAVACSGGDGGSSAASTTTTTTSTTTTTEPPPSTTTTTLPPVIITSQPGTFVVTDFGAVADAKNNDSPAFQAAVDAAAAEGGIVVVPAVGGRRAYVLNHTIDVPSGVSIVGTPAGTGLDVAGPYPWPDTDIAGVKLLARPSPADAPLFRLAPGTTIRGLWITYDGQPFPTNEELVDEEYGYDDFREVRDSFIEEHVAPAGPTLYVEDGSQVTIQDVIADRYYDFLFVKRGGPLRVEGITLYGYRHGFTIADSEAMNTFSDVTFAPIVGPFSPEVSRDLVVEDEDPHSWVFGAIATNPENIGFLLGRSDGFVMDNVSFRAGHTAVQLGASFDFPVVDPIDGEFTTSIPGFGPWGQIQDLRISDAVMGFHLVAPSANTLQMSNVSMNVSVDDGAPFAAVDGSGSVGSVSRQGFMVAGLTYTATANGSPPTVPAILASNLAIGSTTDTRLFSDAAQRIDEVNGRVFLIDGDIGMEVNGFSLAPPLEEALLVASGTSADEVSIRIRGILVAGRPEADKLVEKDGVTVLTGDILVIQPPPPPPVTVTVPVTTTTGAPSETTTTTAAPTTTTTTTTTTAAPPPTTTAP